MRLVKLIALSALSGAALTACAYNAAPMATTTAASAPVTAAPEAAPTAAPAPRATLGSFGFDSAGMDRNVVPGDDFYGFANGTWARTTAIPADKSNYGMFTLLGDLSLTRTRGILDEARGNASSQIGRAYASYLDTAGIEARGMAPIEPWLNRVRGIRTKADYLALSPDARRHGIASLVGAGVGQDDRNPENYITSMGQGGIGMPDRDYYLGSEPRFASARAAYLRYLEAMLGFAGEANAPARARAILDFETGIARAHWTRVDSRDATKTYNKLTLAQLSALAPNLKLGDTIAALGMRGDAVLVAQPSAVRGIDAAFARAPLGVLKDQMLVRSLGAYADYLPERVGQAQFDFYEKTLSGTPEREERWKRAVRFTEGVLPDALSQEYVARFYPPETKAAMDQLVGNVLSAMGRRIDGLSWMQPQTKARARAKLANFTVKIGYPDRWRDYSGLEIKADDAFGNAWRSNAFDFADNASKLGQPLRRWEWFMTPMTINAYANFGMNEIVFPAAILQPPFFDPHADPAVNYGGIGAVIGHEISHHFDDQGSKYDERGRLADWWTPQDVAAFTAAGRKLVEQYNAYDVLGEHVNGQFTLGENIGDLAGLAIAYDAYKASLGGREAPVIDGMTGDQRFYLGWAQVWRRNYRDANLLQRLTTDPHSPSIQRVYVVRNQDPWYAAYNVQPGQRLYLPPAERVRVW